MSKRKRTNEYRMRPGVNFFLAGPRHVRFHARLDGVNRAYLGRLIDQRGRWDTKTVFGDDADRVRAAVELSWVGPGDQRTNAIKSNIELLDDLFKWAAPIHDERVMAKRLAKGARIQEEIDALGDEAD